MRTWTLYAAVSIVSACGMTYELELGTLASYVLGNAAREFAVVLGLYLCAMGAGAWLSGRVETRLVRRFVQLEIVVALVGGLSAPLLAAAGTATSLFSVLLYASVSLVGAMVGAELPLLMRALRASERVGASESFKDVVGSGFALDHLGALVASLLFPLVLVPLIGLYRVGPIAGVCNAGVALAGTWILSDATDARPTGRLRWLSATAVIVLVVAAASTGVVGLGTPD